MIQTQITLEEIDTMIRNEVEKQFGSYEGIAVSVSIAMQFAARAMTMQCKDSIEGNICAGVSMVAGKLA